MMRRIEFDRPVKIAFGKRGKFRTVSTVFEATHCLQSEKWPTKSGPFMQIAKDALRGAKTGDVTPAEARQAFADAALEAHILARN